MNAELTRRFRFEAGHHLPNCPPEHKCSHFHGHSYGLSVTVSGAVDPRAGWVMDFAQLKGAVDPLVARLDHANLNEVEGLANPTSELIAKWFWDRLKPALPGLAAVTVHESENASCTYRGE
jgi:6-pyruvoyltetrahydropterin/6-carboxytetrahydropterin synthase